MARTHSDIGLSRLWTVSRGTGSLSPVDLATAACVTVSTVLVGIFVPTAAVWVLVTSAIVLGTVYFALAGTNAVLAAVLIVSPLVVGAQRVPFVGVQFWGLLLPLLAFALTYRLLVAWVSGARARCTKSDLVAALLFLWLVLSYVSAGSRDVDLRLFAQWTAIPFLMYVAGRVAFSGAHPGRWMMVVAVGASLAAVETFIELRLGRPLFDAAGTYEWSGDAYRAGSMLQGPNFAAIYFAMSLAVLLPLVNRANVQGRWAALIAVLLPTTYIATRSIGGSIVMGVALAGALIARGSWVLRGFVVAAMLLLLSPPVRTLIAEQEFFAAHNVSIATRVDVIQSAKIAAEYLQRDPTRIVSGAGYGQWQRIGGQFAIGEAATTPGQSLENTYLALLLEDGLPAAGLFVILIILSVWNGWSRRADPVALGGALAALVLAIAAGTGTLLVIPQVLGLALFLLPAAYTAYVVPSRTAPVGRRL